jgi:hypothetical protein
MRYTQQEMQSTVHNYPHQQSWTPNFCLQSTHNSQSMIPDEPPVVPEVPVAVPKLAQPSNDVYQKTLHTMARDPVSTEYLAKQDLH